MILYHTDEITFRLGASRALAQELPAGARARVIGVLKRLVVGERAFAASESFGHVVLSCSNRLGLLQQHRGAAKDTGAQ